MINKISLNSHLPKYEQLKQILRQKIKNKEYKLGEAIPSERQMPALFNVSKHTVLRAITDLVQDGLLYREHGRGTFVKKANGNATNGHDARVISFIVHNISDYFISEICRGIEDTAKQKGYRVMVFNSDCSPGKEAENIRMLEETNASGAVIYPFPGQENTEEIFKLKQDNYPFVLVDIFLKDIKTDYVVVDNAKGGFLAVKHLTDLGHKRIGFIGFIESSTGFDRFEGYRNALGKAWIPYDENLVIDIPHSVVLETMGREEEAGRHGEIDRLLNLKNRPTAVFCGNDYIAIGVIKRVLELGLRVPEDLAVVGFDNLPISSLTAVPLTSVAQPKFEIGKAAGEILIDQIEGKQAELKEIVLDVELVIRDSSGGER